MRVIAYHRVSTARQGRSGLGLEAQKAAIETLARDRAAAVIATFTEVESGKRSDRPELTKALNHARLTGATLVIAKLDRLSRNAARPSANSEVEKHAAWPIASISSAPSRLVGHRPSWRLAMAKACGGMAESSCARTTAMMPGSVNAAITSDLSRIV